jgi:agmatinase
MPDHHERAYADPFLGARSSVLIPGSPAIVGCPLDLTTTFRSGTGKGPRAIRIASESIETYSPFLDRDLSDVSFADLGDIPFAGADLELSLKAINERITLIPAAGSSCIALGGEHTLTLPVLQAMLVTYPDLMVIHADAHSDLRDDYEGSLVNHATVMKRVVELIGQERLIQLGIRSGTREEFQWMRREHTRLSWDEETEARLVERVGNSPVYLTLDLDVLDPACLPGTGNPEPGGWFYDDMERLISMLAKMRFVSADVVELNPKFDSSGRSAVTAAKIVRELLLILCQ